MVADALQMFVLVTLTLYTPLIVLVIFVRMGVASDEVKPMDQAIALLDRSAAAGFVPAMNMLGATLFQNPALLPQPAAGVQATALGLMEAAAAKDDLHALFNLGNIYLSQEDRPKALTYLRKGPFFADAPNAPRDGDSKYGAFSLIGYF